MPLAAWPKCCSVITESAAPGQEQAARGEESAASAHFTAEEKKKKKKSPMESSLTASVLFQAKTLLPLPFKLPFLTQNK